MKTIKLKFIHMLVILSLGCQAETKNNEKMETAEATPVKMNPGKNSVSFQSEGVNLVGDLYLPKDYKEGNTYPGVVVGGSWTTVKEQMAGLYAQELANRGFVTLAFDHRHYGESGGEPRFVEIPKEKSEDFINAMDYLHSLPMVDKNKTAGLGVCASGGYMAESVAKDNRFKAYSMVVPWFNTEEVVNAFYGGEEGINDRLTKAKDAQKKYKKTGEMSYIESISDTNPNAAMYGPFDYYLDPNLGKVPNWSADKFALTNWTEWLNYRPVNTAKKIDTPTLIITSEGSATPAAAKEFYALLEGPKEMETMEGGQLDFYHKMELVKPSMDKTAAFFNQNM